MGANIVVILQVLSKAGGDIVEGSPRVSEVGVATMTGWGQSVCVQAAEAGTSWVEAGIDVENGITLHKPRVLLQIQRGKIRMRGRILYT